jgi:2-(1,2-epoxy-1,2-dihydrophenyl)acetyl-CoA isomerase
MTDMVAMGQELYIALRAGDVEALRRLLSADFRGELTAGLPRHLGRVHEGLDAMIADGWGAVDALFDMAPQVETLHDGGDVLIARGHYVGKVRSTEKPFRAAFAHFWTCDGVRFTGLHQVTDSAMWEHALR